jgi:DNA-binding CsgD family transcriptional regulator
VIDFVDTALQDEVARLIGMASSHGRVRHVAWVEDKVKNVKWLISVDALSGRVGLASQFKNVFATNERVYMLTIRELGGNSLLAPDTIKSIFGLTPTEADLAYCLLRGETASEIARQRGVSKNTVHNQLASAMARVGVNRQTQFLHCLSMLSAMC